TVMTRAEHIHFKDYSEASEGFVTLGEGDVDVAGYIRSLLDLAGDKQLTFSIETHAKSDQLENTRKSLNHLRQCLADLNK
ncbi:MAG: hypothetical protein AAGB04_24480, partial [Pseudomonadota bacterium]